MGHRILPGANEILFTAIADFAESLRKYFTRDMIAYALLDGTDPYVITLSGDRQSSTVSPSSKAGSLFT